MPIAIRWYFVPDGTPPCPPGPVRSRSWLPDKTIDPAYGETLPYRFRFADGSPPPSVSGRCPEFPPPPTIRGQASIMMSANAVSMEATGMGKASLLLSATGAGGITSRGGKAFLLLSATGRGIVSRVHTTASLEMSSSGS